MFLLESYCGPVIIIIIFIFDYIKNTINRMLFLDYTVSHVFSLFRPTARRKPEPVSDMGEARIKFGDMKAISSDMYFGKQDKSEVYNGNVWCKMFLANLILRLEFQKTYF